MNKERSTKLSALDLRFLVCLYASEESYIYEIFQDFRSRLLKPDNISALVMAKLFVKDLLLKKIVALGSGSSGKENYDFDLENALKIIELDSSWEEPRDGELRSNIYIYFTDSGENKWNNGFPYISRKREMYLTFGDDKI